MRGKKFMLRVCFISLFCVLGLVGVYAQNLPEKAQDISPLLIGEELPDAKLEDEKGNEIIFKDVLKKSLRNIIIFYRGGWCMYCNRQLSGFSKVLEDFKKIGFNVIAISSDSPDNLNNIKEKNKLNIECYSDSNTELIRKIGIAFKAPNKYSKILKKGSNGGNESVLPVPSIFITNRKGEILFEYINPDYKKRISEKILLRIADNFAVR